MTHAGGTVEEAGLALLPVVAALALLAISVALLNLVGPLEGGVAATERRTARASYVAQAGLHHALSEAQAANCSGYADLATTPFGNDSYEVTFSPAQGSPVSVTATGTLADGTVHTTERSSVRLFQTLTNLSMQPGSEGVDTWIYEWSTAANFGQSLYMRVSDENHGLIRFDLSGLPPGTIIESATLELYAENLIHTGDVAAHRVSSQWLEGSGTGGAPGDGATWNTSNGVNVWNTLGGDYAVPAVGSVTVASETWHGWDLSGVVSDWVAGVYPNHGVLLRTDHPLMEAEFTADDSADAVHRPKLVVSYRCECGTGPAGTLLLNANTDSYIESANPNLNNGDDNRIHLKSVSGTERGVLQFDLGSLPPTAEVTAATLQLFTDSATGSPEVAAHAVDGMWTETGVTWNDRSGSDSWANPGADYDPVPVALATVQSGASVSWNVTAAAADWATGTLANNGLLLVAGAGAGEIRFVSRDDSSEADRPLLRVDYICPCGAACGTVAPTTETITVQADGDAYLRDDTPDLAYGAEADIRVGRRTWDEFRSLLRFDLSAVPAGATVASALLRLNRIANDGNGNMAVRTFQVPEAWNEATVTWISISGALGGDPVVDFVLDLNASGWLEIGIPTTLVHEWIDGVTPNNGLVMVQAEALNNRRIFFASRDNPDPDLHPQLVLEYQP